MCPISGAPQPPDEQENPYYPKGPQPLIFEEFLGINTQTTRPGVDDKQMWWCDSFMPIGRRFLRTMYGIAASAIYTASGTTIAFFDFGNIGATPICIVFLSNGGIVQVNTSTGVATTMATAGTIINPSSSQVGVSQWSNQYVIIVANQTNGYFLWDGTSLYTAGALAPGVTITAGGSGYSSTPVVTASGGSGGGATFTATVTNGVIVSIAITDPGSAYQQGNTVTVNISDATGSGATATVSLMPFGISGTSADVYTGHVWVINGPLVQWSAPGSVTDFSTASGGGNFSSVDSFLRIGFTRVISLNGFLYLIADSSINYISGVQTSGSPPTTTFTNQNANPEVGTPWPSTVDSWDENFVFANTFGVHISYGSRVVKTSAALDGIYNTVPNFGGFLPSAAKATVFGKKLWMLLLPIVDPISGQAVNKLLMWDGKMWWAASQEITLRYIQHQEISSVLTAYGTDGNSIYALFQQPSVSVRKTVQSKLWDAPGGYQFGKAVTRLWGLVQYFRSNSPTINVSIDNESGQSPQAVSVGPPTLSWTNNAGNPIVWTNASAQPIVWTSAGLAVFDPQAVAQTGILTGMTIQTNCDDVALISATMQDEIVSYRG